MRVRIVSAFARLFAVGASVTVVAVLLRTRELAAETGIGRLRDFEPLIDASRRILSAARVPGDQRMAWISWLHEPYPLWGAAEWARFLAPALALHLLLVAILALVGAVVAAFGIAALERHARGSLLARALRRPPRVSAAALGGLGVGLLLLSLAGQVLPDAGARDVVYTTASERRPNVLLISVDTLRADHLGSYGYERPTSPNIDRIAREGARFENVVSPSSWTLPTHVTMLTGLPPLAHGMNQNQGLRLDPGITTLPERLRDAGYQTAAFVAGGYVSAEYGYLQGFEHYDDYSVPQRCRHEGEDYRSCQTGPELIERAMARLGEWDDAGREQPFFYFVHLWDVHNDYLPPEPYAELFTEGEPLDFTVGMILDREVPAASLTKDEREQMIALYDGEIRFTDEWIGRLLAELEERGVLDETIVVVTSDHGEELGDRERWGHHKALYDESVMVPLVLRHPAKVPAGRIVTEQVQLADVVPTLLSLVGLDTAAFARHESDVGGEARDLTPLLARHRREWESAPAFGELHGRLRSVRTSRWKLIHDDEAGSVELYDLIADPGEQRNVAAERPVVVERLSKQLAAWARRWDRNGESTRSLTQSEDHLEQLRALGYIE